MTTKQSKQKQKIIELTPEENQDRKHLIALVLVEELKQHRDASDTTARSIIVKRAKEYARYCEKISKVSSELRKIIVIKEKLCSSSTFSRALNSPEFEQFKDIHQAKRRSHPNKTNSGVHMNTQVPNSSPAVETGTKSGTYAKPMQQPTTTTAENESIPQHTLDARQAIEQSNEMQTAIGKLEKILSGKSIEDQIKHSNEDVGKTQLRKMLDQSSDHLLDLVKKMPDGHFWSMKISIQRISVLIEKFEDLLSNEAISRKRTESMAGV